LDVLDGAFVVVDKTDGRLGNSPTEHQPSLVGGAAGFVAFPDWVVPVSLFFA
jgi:hypothetical protein